MIRKLSGKFIFHVKEAKESQNLGSCVQLLGQAKLRSGDAR